MECGSRSSRGIGTGPVVSTSSNLRGPFQTEGSFEAALPTGWRMEHDAWEISAAMRQARSCFMVPQELERGFYRCRAGGRGKMFKVWKDKGELLGFEI